jgi:hypothetical protein
LDFQKANHYEVIPLCPSHHQGAFSIHNTKRQFEAMYGTEAELLHRTLKEIKSLEQVNDFFNLKGENNG